ncbi:MAG: GNAT family N-acetyltransferase [Alphaproteobacteria bacterium]|nr:GNAT family N-acetyltransferase [Alphaproteobacteria bacterium]
MIDGRRGAFHTAGMELTTPRLRLRPPRFADREAFALLFAEPAVRRYLAIGELDAAAAERFAEQFIGTSRYELRRHGSGALSVTLAGGGAAIGYCGIRPLPDRSDARELVYALLPDCWGSGLATEAAAACLDWCFRSLPMAHAIGFARAENVASCRVMRKLGMEHRGLSARYYDWPLAEYAAAASSWLAARVQPIEARRSGATVSLAG